MAIRHDDDFSLLDLQSIIQELAEEEAKKRAKEDNREIIRRVTPEERMQVCRCGHLLRHHTVLRSTELKERYPERDDMKCKYPTCGCKGYILQFVSNLKKGE